MLLSIDGVLCVCVCVFFFSFLIMHVVLLFLFHGYYIKDDLFPLGTDRQWLCLLGSAALKLFFFFLNNQDFV